MFKTPNFWYQKSGWQSFLLYPFSLLVQLVGWLRKSKPVKLALPVICVGNVVAGGAGKTPTCIALGKLCKSFKKPGFLSRGYGGSIVGPAMVGDHSYAEVGDEPLILAQSLPTWAAKDRIVGAEAAMHTGLDLLIMDDGFQNPGFIKDLTFLVVDGHQGFGNGHVLPAGPLRETVDSAMKRTDAIIVINDRGISEQLHKYKKPIFFANIIPSYERSDKPVVAFAGLGYPEKFFAMLRELEMDVHETIPFPDHHPYTHNDIEKLKKIANGKILVTTRKDMIKIPKGCRDNIVVIDIELIFEQPEKVQEFIREKII